MKSFAAILCLFALTMVGCKQTQSSQIPEQYEPAFADDGFSDSANNLQQQASDIGNKFSSKIEQAGSTLKDTASNVRESASSFKNDMSDIANQFEPMD